MGLEPFVTIYILLAAPALLATFLLEAVTCLLFTWPTHRLVLQLSGQSQVASPSKENAEKQGDDEHDYKGIDYPPRRAQSLLYRTCQGLEGGFEGSCTGNVKPMHQELEQCIHTIPWDCRLAAERKCIVTGLFRIVLAFACFCCGQLSLDFRC